jgi:iron(II)-dependent oxidoreductase
MKPCRSQPAQCGLWRRFTFATILLLVAWNIWPQADIWSPAAASCCGLFGLTLMAGLLSKLRLGRAPVESEACPISEVDQQEPEAETAAETETDPICVLVNRMLVHGRQALLLRPELAANLTSEQRQKAQHDLSDAMSVVAGGDVGISPWEIDDDPEGGYPTEHNDRKETVNAFWLDRLQVSNLQFQGFVDECGYENESFWSICVRKQIGNFVDKTQMPGPRFWEQGKFPAGLEDHPVVGICWYEAEAFARWQGKRLPSDAEWLIAACGPLNSDDDGHSVQRLYPWGQDPKTGVANLWGSELTNGGKVGTVATNSLPDGATNTGIQQLLGNAWEWMASEFRISNNAEELILDHPVKSLRGGAYDSYFGDQATCQLQSGDCPLARKHNIGFRCAVTASVLATDVAS